jgi:hypothetical protein
MAVYALAAQPGGGAALDPSAYIQELQRTSVLIRGAATVEEVRPQVPNRWTVRIEHGAIVVDTRWIQDDMTRTTAASWPSVRARIADRLDAMRLEIIEATPRYEGDPTQLLAQTLASKEFQQAQSSRWFDELRERVAAWLRQFLDRVFGSAAGSRGVGMFLAWTVTAIAVVALAVWLRSLAMRRPRATALDLEPLARRTPAREWALRAVAAVRNGDIREAVRCGYHAAVQRLDEQGTWTVDESRTPREYVGLLDGGDPRRPTIADLIRRFENIWYGNHPGGGDDARAVAATLERLGCLRPGEHTS